MTRGDEPAASMTIREKMAAMNHAAMIQAYYSSREAADRMSGRASDSGLTVETWMPGVARCEADALLAELVRGGE